jgi:16S rRNA (uracil1498-N3)-methyltransferase
MRPGLRAHKPRLIIPAVARRIHLPALSLGDLPLDSAQAHHARDVLRLESGETVEAFDDEGFTAVAILQYLANGDAIVRIERIAPPADEAAFPWIIAAAVPKGDRADWMVEKLSELGASAFIPLAAARSVVLPEGKGKRERWTRIATEAAKQSRRVGVMKIEELTPVQSAINRPRHPSAKRWVLTTEIPSAKPISLAMNELAGIQSLTIFVGPEGGWTEAELSAFVSAGIAAVKLGRTILRIETAAIAAAAILSTLAIT